MGFTASLFGILGIFANVIIYQQNKGRSLLICKLVSDLMWILHYFSLNAFSGMAVACVGILRECVFLMYLKKSVPKKWLVVFIVLAVISAVVTWKNIFSILPATASVVSVISFWRANSNLTRILSYPISASMLTYDIICGSYTGILNEILTLLSTTLGVFRYKNQQKNLK